MRKTFALVTIAAAVALAGCGKKDQKVYTDDKGNSMSVSNTGDHMTITGNNGEKVEYGTGSNVKMPDYLPLYPGATVTTSMTGQGKDGSGGFVVFHAAAQPADIIAFYKQKAGAAGMADALNMQTGNSMTYMASNDKEKKSLSVTATKAADGTDAQVTWGMK
jgi:predicted small lipoprotein YifL